VRRVDPRTGEKINKLRKSYEGKVKDLRLAGRNKAVSAPGQWVPSLLGIPDDDYHATRVLGKEIEKGLEPAKLARAMAIVPGKLPDREAEQWRQILATDDPAPRPPPKPALAGPGSVPAAIVEQKQQAAAKAVAMAGASAVTAAASSAASAAAAAVAAKNARPERQGTKRSYADASFVGYGEGYDDDETDSDGRSLNIRRKRRKVSGSHVDL
jgi:hypothetical protein